MPTDGILDALFGGRPHPLGARTAAWLASSRRFADFVAAFDTKIRKKLRGARDEGSLRDLELELETAWLLLRERALSLVYEPQTGGRGPDFAVAFTTRSEVMIEVARLRSLRSEARSGPEMRSEDFDPRLDGRFAGVVARKLGQLAPDRANVLLIGIEPPVPSADDLRAAMIHLQRRAERDDPGVVRRAGFRDRGEFFGRYRRLSAVLVRGIPLSDGERVALWLNPQTRNSLSNEVRAALLRSHLL